MRGAFQPRLGRLSLKAIWQRDRPMAVSLRSLQWKLRDGPDSACADIKIDADLTMAIMTSDRNRSWESKPRPAASLSRKEVL
jgi:hypothetical protein